MKLVRFLHQGSSRCGILDGNEITGLDNGFFGTVKQGRKLLLSEVKLLSPCTPSKIVAVGLNYRDHAEELGFPIPEEPVIFLKPPTTVIGPGDEIRYPAASSRVDFEAELGIVIRKQARNITPAQAQNHILGFTCANDVTARDLQKKDGQWTRAKSFDTFCPIGPWIETDLDPADLLIESYLNNERKQSSRTSRFIFTMSQMVSFIAGIMTLEPGDVIITGTPAGIGSMQRGDEIEVRIEGIGSLRNKVR